MPKEILLVGDNCIDIYQNLKQYYLTGNVVDTAVNMAIAGSPVAIITNIATDKYGQEMLELFKRHGLATDKIRVVEGQTAYTLMQLIEGERIHGDYYEGVLEGIDFASDLDYAKGFDLVFSAFWGNAESLFLQLAQEDKRPLLAFDYADRHSDPKVAQLDGCVDIGIFSWDQDEDAGRKFLQERADKGMKIGVLTFGAEGSLAYDGKDFFRQEAVKVDEVVNTVGAGDSFIAGFLSSYAQGSAIPACLVEGSAMAAKVIQQFAPILGEKVYQY